MEYDSPITLGELIDKLSVCNQDASVYFDFLQSSPTTLDSYRGYYDQLALGWDSSSDAPTVASLIDNLCSAIGATFTGWKGGEFVMDRNTQVWCDNPGRCTGTAIVDIDDNGYCVLLVTAALG